MPVSIEYFVLDRSWFESTNVYLAQWAAQEDHAFQDHFIKIRQLELELNSSIHLSN